MQIPEMPCNCVIVLQTTSSSEDEEKNICRICLSQEDVENELISPCNCKGSIQLMHSSCFKDYTLSKTTQESSVLACELCGFEFKTRIKIKSNFSFKKLFQEKTNSLLFVVGPRAN